MEGGCYTVDTNGPITAPSRFCNSLILFHRTQAKK